MSAPVDLTGRIAALLRAVARYEREGCTTTAAGLAAGLPRATTHRLLTSLMREGLIDRDSGTGVWGLGPEAYLLGLAATPRYDVTEAARPTVRRLAEETGESAFFSTRRDDETVCLIRLDGSFPLRSHVLHEGLRLPLGVASAGLAILAHLEEPERERYLASRDLVADFGPQHAAPLLREHVERTRRAGYAVNPGLIVEGSWGLGAAVFDVQGRPRWALSLTGVESRFRSPRREDLGALLLREAHRLGQRLAHGRA